MIVLSLFDGISCAYEALRRAGIEVKTYYASEIEKNAIKISQKNHPDIIQLGDVKSITGLPHIDLLIGGSPCTDLSIAKKGRKGLEGEHSSLFWEYARLKRELNPTYFILENVASMPKKDRDIITQELGVEPVLFNASLVSAQSRKRYFWTNIKFELPEDRGILLKDILQPDAEVDDRFVVNGKSFCLTSSYSKVSASPAQVEHNAKSKQRTMVQLSQPKEHEFIQVGYFGSPTKNNVGGQALRVYKDEGKSTTSGVGLYAIGRDIGRRLNEDGKREDDNQEIPVTRRIEMRTDNKSNTLTSIQKDNLVVGQQIRRLTPIECERLQGLPDNYTEGIPMTHRYKVLGNAFNVDVVAHILSGLDKERKSNSV